MNKPKICFAASTGGHFEQLMMLKPLMLKYNSFIVTEKTNYDISVSGIKIYHLLMVNRKEISFIPRMIVNLFKSLFIVIKERPQYIVCTGVLAMIPMCLFTKALGGKLIYIESFAKLTTPTETGKLLYKYADQFYVQWESMLKVYPKAKYLGGIY